MNTAAMKQRVSQMDEIDMFTRLVELRDGPLSSMRLGMSPAGPDADEWIAEAGEILRVLRDRRSSLLDIIGPMSQTIIQLMLSDRKYTKAIILKEALQPTLLAAGWTDKQIVYAGMDALNLALDMVKQAGEYAMPGRFPGLTPGEILA